VIVCENEGADWAPFRTFATFKAGVNGNGSREVVWELAGELCGQLRPRAYAAARCCTSKNRRARTISSRGAGQTRGRRCIDRERAQSSHHWRGFGQLFVQLTILRLNFG
jgi:hypothetical protein